MTLADLLAFERRRWSDSPRRLNKLGHRLPWLGAVLWLVASVILVQLGWVRMQTFALVWLALLGILYAAPAMAAKGIKREWREETAWWWLSLPAPREKLLLAKWASILGHWLRLWLGLFIYIAVYVAALSAAAGGFSWPAFLEQLKFALAAGLLALVLGPLLITAGMWMGIMRREARWLIALMWFALIGVLNFQGQIMGLKVLGQGSDIKVELSPNYFWIGFEFIAAYVLTGVLFAGLVRWLKNGGLQ